MPAISQAACVSNFPFIDNILEVQAMIKAVSVQITAGILLLASCYFTVMVWTVCTSIICSGPCVDCKWCQMYRGREYITYICHTWANFGEIRELVTAQLLKWAHVTMSIAIYCQFTCCAYAIYKWF